MHFDYRDSKGVFTRGRTKNHFSCSRKSHKENLPVWFTSPALGSVLNTLLSVWEMPNPSSVLSRPQWGSGVPTHSPKEKTIPRRCYEFLDGGHDSFSQARILLSKKNNADQIWT